MPSYSFRIMKSDHYTDGKPDLHVHVYFNRYREGGRLLGRYRLPTLEPVFGNEPELNNNQISELAGWLTEEPQLKKLKTFLDETMFDLHKMAKFAPRFGEIIRERGNTYINIRIPITERIRY